MKKWIIGVIAFLVLMVLGFMFLRGSDDEAMPPEITDESLDEADLTEPGGQAGLDENEPSPEPESEEFEDEAGEEE